MKTKLEIFTILPKNNHKLGDLFTFLKLFYTKINRKRRLTAIF